MLRYLSRYPSCYGTSAEIAKAPFGAALPFGVSLRRDRHDGEDSNKKSFKSIRW
jgi:hypothetical protein